MVDITGPGFESSLHAVCMLSLGTLASSGGPKTCMGLD